MTANLSRRAFLSSTGAFVVALATPPIGRRRRRAKPGDRSSPIGSIPISRSKRTARSRPTTARSTADRGSAPRSPQMVAEELDVPLERVHLVMGDTGRTVNMGGASAATGVSRAGMKLREMAAEARRLMIEHGRQELGVAGRAADGDRRRRPRHGRCEEAHLLCGPDRRRSFRYPGEVERPTRARPCGRRGRPRSRSRRTSRSSAIAAAPRSAGKSVRHPGDGAGRAAARHAACAHDPAEGRGRRAGQGRRRLDQGYSRRKGGPHQGPARGRRREGMERGAGGARSSR